MMKFGFATAVARGLTAAVLSLAAPAQADLGHNIWAHDQNGYGSSGSSALIPHVDTSVHH
jgi:hypothetical protein